MSIDTIQKTCQSLLENAPSRRNDEQDKKKTKTKKTKTKKTKNAHNLSKGYEHKLL